MLSSCGFGTRSEVNERPEADKSTMKIHAAKWKGYGDMEKMCDKCHSTTRKSGSALALVSLAIQLDRARCECACPTHHRFLFCAQPLIQSVQRRMFEGEKVRVRDTSSDRRLWGLCSVGQGVAHGKAHV